MSVIRNLKRNISNGEWVRDNYLILNSNFLPSKYWLVGNTNLEEILNILVRINYVV